ncbi:MAG: hypothetical protein GWN32_10495, partial [Gemmatimonadetes bacterium]|nr:hypothetical protein [Gemmatimonadota bacterium]
DQHRDDEALAEMDVVDQQLLRDRDLFRMERDVLRSRLEMRGGDYQAAFRRLRRSLRQASPERDAASWGALLSQVRLSSERLAVTEGFALLAICARETGNDEVFSWALAEARDRGVDVSNLR